MQNRGAMDNIIQRLQIEALKTQLSLLQLGHAYLAGRCASADSIGEETLAMLKLIETRRESAVLQRVLDLAQGKVRPMWG
jgi:hypothetical protein